MLKVDTNPKKRGSRRAEKTSTPRKLPKIFYRGNNTDYGPDGIIMEWLLSCQIRIESNGIMKINMRQRRADSVDFFSW